MRSGTVLESGICALCLDPGRFQFAFQLLTVWIAIAVPAGRPPDEHIGVAVIFVEHVQVLAAEIFSLK